MKFSSYAADYSDYEDWRAICPEGHWKRLSPSALTGRLPQRLLDKANAVFAPSSASSAHSAFVLNINRVDAPASAIDQDAFFIAFDHSASTADAYFTHHGDWPGRTTNPGSSFFDAVAASGIEHYYPYAHMPMGSSGLLSDVDADPQAAEWWNAMKAIREARPSS